MGDASIQALNPISLASLPSATPPVLQPAVGISQPSNMPLDSNAMEAAKKFETILIDQLTHEMKKTIPSSGLLSSSAIDQYQDLFWSQLSDQISSKGGLGMAKQIYNQMVKHPHATAGASAGRETLAGESSAAAASSNQAGAVP